MSHAPAYALSVAPNADSQIAAATIWWREHRPAAADLLRDDVGAALLLICEHPEIGAKVRNRKFGSVRLLVLRRTPYLLYYQLLPLTREVRVVHFRHGRRRALRPRS